MQEPKGHPYNPYDLILNDREITAFTAYYGFIEESEWIDEMLRRGVKVIRLRFI